MPFFCIGTEVNATFLGPVDAHVDGNPLGSLIGLHDVPIYAK